MSGSEMDEIVDDFISEANENLESLDQKFVELENNPGDSDLLNDIFRSMHTMKGAAGFLGFTQMVDVTHVAEDVMNLLRKGELEVTPEIMDVILETVDMVRILLRNIEDRNDRVEEIEPIVNSLKAILESGSPGGGPQVPSPATPPALSDDDEELSESMVAVEAEAAKAAESVSDAEYEAMLAELNGKSAGGGVSKEGGDREVETQKAKPERVEPEKGGGKRSASPGGGRDQNIRVDLTKLDKVLNLAGELVLARNTMINIGHTLGSLDPENETVSRLDEAVSHLDIVTTDLHLGVMKMRMQPVGKVFNRFPRMVRDLARSSGKEIELIIEGEETELDKTVIDEIGDPLVHLVRNSIDHGIEDPDVREGAGKARKGTLTLSAFQEGRHIVLAIKDDGKGINAAKIKESAVNKGLITEDAARAMGETEALNLIFMPGFSTAEKVTDISGRGVGMDVVKTNISKIGGTITIHSTFGVGTEILFHLPLTLAIIQALIVQSNEEYYALPLSNVEENIRVSPSDIRTVSGVEVLQLRESVIPVLRLNDLVESGSGSPSLDEDGLLYLVFVAMGEKRVGLIVDALHGQEEIVIKPLGDYLKGIDGIAGACIKGDGKVILILDVAGLVSGINK